MSKCQVIGFKRVSFKDEQSGEMLSGWRIWIAFPTKGVTGCMTDRIFLLDGKSTYVPQVDDMVSIFYNRRGKVDDIQVI